MATNKLSRSCQWETKSRAGWAVLRGDMVLIFLQIWLGHSPHLPPFSCHDVNFRLPPPCHHIIFCLNPPFPSRNDVMAFYPHNTSSRSKTGASVKLRFLSQIQKNVSWSKNCDQWPEVFLLFVLVVWVLIELCECRFFICWFNWINKVEEVR